MMGTDLLSNTKGERGLLVDARTAAIVESFRVHAEDGTPMLERLPTPAERNALLSRADDLARVLAPARTRPADLQAAARAVAAMFAGYPSLRRANAEEMTAAYVAHLQELPLHAIQAACDDVVHGGVDGLDPDWPPSSPRLHEAASRHAAKRWNEKRAIDAVLSARLLPPADEKRSAAVGQRLRELADAMRAKTDAAVSERMQEARDKKLEANKRQILDEYRRRGMEPVHADGELLSPYLLDVLKKERA